jgi:hypothetical protein
MVQARLNAGGGACTRQFYGPRFKSAEVIMKTEHLFVCIVAASMSLIGCAKKESSEPPLTPASSPNGSSSEAPAAVEEETEAIEPRQCVSNDDCGKGYVCGFDPSQSRVVRYCMAE